jgi:hypothetical protein
MKKLSMLAVDDASSRAEPRCWDGQGWGRVGFTPF